jgi:hypothetical protein
LAPASRAGCVVADAGARPVVATLPWSIDSNGVGAPVLEAPALGLAAGGAAEGAGGGAGLGSGATGVTGHDLSKRFARGMALHISSKPRAIRSRTDK